MPNPNIHDAVLFNLHPRVREFLDLLDQSKQIDRDEQNTPHIIAVEFPAKSLHRCVFLRNGKPENFVIHTRKKADPFRSWREEDGFLRPEREEPPAAPSRKERQRRVFESIVKQILRG